MGHVQRLINERNGMIVEEMVDFVGLLTMTYGFHLQSMSFFISFSCLGNRWIQNTKRQRDSQRLSSTPLPSKPYVEHVENVVALRTVLRLLFNPLSIQQQNGNSWISMFLERNPRKSFMHISSAPFILRHLIFYKLR